MTLLIRSDRVEKCRDFISEHRACRDVQQLVTKAIVHVAQQKQALAKVVESLFADIVTMYSYESFPNVDEFNRELFVESSQGTAASRVQNRIQGFVDRKCRRTNTMWAVLHASFDCMTTRHVGIALLSSSSNCGVEMETLRAVVLVIGPTKEKATKSVFETAKTFASLLDSEFVMAKILQTTCPIKVRELLLNEAKYRADHISLAMAEESENATEEVVVAKTGEETNWKRPGSGIVDDFRRRRAHYISDYKDGISDVRSFSKVISTAVFLIFTILPTSIAYGMLHDENTKGLINVQKVVLGQWIGGLVFGLIGGQPMLILSTTAPLSIYIAVIYEIAKTNGLEFYALYAAVGIWAQAFLILYAIFQAADLMKYCKRSTEEMFSLFISFALIYKAIAAIVSTYLDSYAGCFNRSILSPPTLAPCQPDASLLFVLLVFGTLLISLLLSNFRFSSFLSSTIRELIADYALPIAVILMALVTRFFFFNVPRASFNVYQTADLEFVHWGLTWSGHVIAVALAFPLSLLFFMDQLLVTKTVDNKQNNLKKGSAHHWDLLVVACLNVFLSVCSLPWMHGALPSAFLHLKALSNVEHKWHNGYEQPVIVRVRETRLAVLLAHALMIPIYFFAIPAFARFFPTSLLHGLFLFMAISSLTGNEFFERITLMFREQKAYPASHYLIKVPQRTVHLFTFIQLLQLALLIIVGFFPVHYVEMIFPVVIALFIPFRQFVLPRLFNPVHLEQLDDHH